MIKFTLNETQFCIKGGISVIEACELVGVDVPRFCYHQNLSVAGNCRMCLVEIANSPKPVASCALPILNNMKIFVDTPLVKKARENVLEMLLLNHPLDCPICDQGGECDLQDQSRMFGLESSRFFFKKRAVENKECGPVIRTIMTRCIHCTRCVRFNSEISGNDFFGTLNRGTLTEIGSYKPSTYNSEISANVIDLCPVGALTSNFYAFKARPWEAITVESIDLTDGLGSNTYINIKEGQITRVFPKTNVQINGNFISDRARFSFDNIRNNRLIENIDKKSFSISNYWLANINFEDKVKKNALFLTNSNADLDSLTFLKNLEFLGKHNIKINTKVVSTPTLKSNFFINWLNSPILELESSDKICIIISSNPRIETPLINTKLFVKSNLNHYSIFGFSLYSQNSNTTKFVNLNLFSTFKIFESKYINVSKLLKASFKPLIIFNKNLFQRGLESNFFINLIKSINSNSVLIRTSISINDVGLDLLNVSRISSKSLNQTNYDHIIALNLEDSSYLNKVLKRFKSKKVTWLNTHKSEVTNYLNKATLLNSKTEYEEENCYLNMEERIQKTHKSVSALNTSFSSKELVKTFLSFYFKSKKYDNRYKLFTKQMNLFIEILGKKVLFNKVSNSLVYNNLVLKTIFHFQQSCTYLVSKYPTKSICEDFYLVNQNLLNSRALQLTSQSVRKKQTNLIV